MSLTICGSYSYVKCTKNNQLTCGTFLIDRLGTKNCQLWSGVCSGLYVDRDLICKCPFVRDPGRYSLIKRDAHQNFFRMQNSFSLLISVNLISLKQNLIPSLIFNSVKNFR